MALLLFYSVIKFLLITLTQKSSKGHAASREAGQHARKERVSVKEKELIILNLIFKKVFLM